MRYGQILIIIGLSVASACDSRDTAPTVTVRDLGQTSDGTLNQVQAVEASKPEPVSPNYSDREGDRYFYASAPSDDDRKRGIATGNIVRFTYLGMSDGRHVLEHVSENGDVLAQLECAEPCRVIKTTAGSVVDRVPFTASSVMGSAFEDALAGRLSVQKRSGVTPVNETRSELPSGSPQIPEAFIGEWNSDLQACGTGNNDSRLRIEPRRIRFYESDGEVRRVAIANERAIKVSASFAGEGQQWTDEIEFVLSRSGNELSSGDITRQRCPA